MEALRGFEAYLLLERSLSAHSIAAYGRDVQKLESFLEIRGKKAPPLEVSSADISDFLQWLHELGLEASSQARILSGLKAFYKYLLVEDLIDQAPTELLEGPRQRRHIPDVLTVEEVNQMLAAIDLSTPHGMRNRAILETLYACGLRVSELTELRITHLYEDIGFVKVTGKNNKERIVPIGEEALKHIRYYMEGIRRQQAIHKDHENYLFVSRLGKKLTRVMVFNIVKDAALQAGIQKNVHPHTFRHSFATHLIEGGADLKAVQDMLGHESILTTEIYTHLDSDFLRETILSFHPRNKK